MQMRGSDEIERLSAAEPELLGRTESFVDASEEEQILEGILATSRPRAGGRSRMSRRRRAVFVLVGAALAVAVVSVASIGRGNRPTTHSTGPHPVALSGATIQLAGYRFRTPAGFKASTSSCGAPAAAAGKPKAVLNGFSAAASADGGCVEAAYLIVPSPQGGTIPPDAQPVDVGQYQGYYAAQDSSGGSTLYVELPKAGGSSENHVYLVLLSQGLTEDQLVAVAVSGLPG
jgi:hypothetical protein